MSHLSISCLTLSEFGRLRPDWQALLVHSYADPLFLSWEWQFSWWSNWGEKLELELKLFTVRDGSTLVAIYPMFASNVNYLFGTTVRRIEFIGNHWRQSPTVRTEYIGPIIKKGREVEVSAMVMSQLNQDDDWDELLICDYCDQSLEANALMNICNRLGRIDLDSDKSYQIDTSGDFSVYRAQLGKNTRLKLLNRQSLASRQGIRFVNLDVSNFKSFIATLNQFHLMRWGKPCFEPDAENFHQLLCQIMGTNQIELDAVKFHLSYLMKDSTILSAQYNLKIGRCLYNIQSGYLENFSNKISLGTLHFGYIIEYCFQDNSIDMFDLLAGIGKETNFKSRFCPDKILIKTTGIYRKKWIWLYLKIRLATPDLIKRLVKKLYG